MKTAFLLISLFAANGVFGQVVSKLISIEDQEFNNYFFNRNNIPRVKGVVKNLSIDEIRKIKIEYSVVTPFEEFQVKNSCSLNADGSFELKLEYAFPYQQIWITIDSLFYTGVYVNTNLFIELDAAILKTHKESLFNGPGVRYLGQDGILNDYTNNHLLFKRETQLRIGNQLQNLLPFAETNYNVFIKKYDSLYCMLINLDSEYIAQNPSNFSWLLTNEIESRYFANLCLVHWGKVMPPELLKKVKAHKPYAISNDGMLFYKYLFTYLNQGARIKSDIGGISYSLAEVTLQTINLFDSLFNPAKSDLLKIEFSSRDPKEYKQKMEIVLQHLKTPWCKTIIKAEYDKTIKKLTAINKILSESKPIVSAGLLGQPICELPFGARLYEASAIKADTLLSRLKNTFQGKALMIDCWATWCVPCISQFPHSKKLSDECLDLPIEFVYLCTSEGSDIEKWKSKIADYKLRGTHIFVEKIIETQLMNLFSVSGFPSYIFINSRGEYKPGLISRPSEMNKDKLTELLNQ